MAEESYERVRRNFYLASLAIIFLRLSEASINGISREGTSIEIGNETGIYILLWIVWVYFGLRIYQLDDYNEVRRAIIDDWQHSFNLALKSRMPQYVETVKNKATRESKSNEFGQQVARLKLDSGFLNLRLQAILPNGGTAGARIAAYSGFMLPFLSGIAGTILGRQSIFDHILPLLLGIITLISGVWPGWAGSPICWLEILTSGCPRI